MDKNKLFNPVDEKDGEFIRELRNASSDSDLSEANDSVDEDEEDYIEEQIDIVDSDQEISTVEDSDVDSDTINSKFVFGKDEKTKWYLTRPIQNVKAQQHNIVRFLPGVKGSARNANSTLECWQAFFTDKLLAVIVENTNKQIESRKEEFSRDRDCKCTDVLEIRAFFGLLYMAGYYKKSKLNTEDLWSSDGSGVELFRLVMSRNRFHLLLRNLRFDDKTTCKERSVLDKLAPIREVFDLFVHGCKTNYTIGQYVTMGEMLAKFRGRCEFRQSIPSKPGKHGIKIFFLVDAKAFYTFNLEVNVEKQPEGPFKQDCGSYEVVKKLCRPIFGSGRNITGDNWFTSYNIAKDLLHEKITYVGTVRKNKEEIPPTFSSVRCRNQFTSKFGFQKNMTLLSYIPKKNKNVILLSTMHNDASIDTDTGTAKIPEIITFYNSTKSGVDVIDKLRATYSVARNTNRWPMAIFHALLDVGAINAYILYKGNKNTTIKGRKQFIKRLSLELVSDQLIRRSKLQSLPRDLRQSTAAISIKMNPENERNEACTDSSKRKRNTEEKEKSGMSRKRCYICERKKNRMTKYTCMKCQNYICLEHSNYVCDVCKTDK